MKTNKLVIPLTMTAALAGLITGSVSCAKKNSGPPSPNPLTPPPTNSVTDNTSPVLPLNTNTAALAEGATNTAPGDITNPPPAETTVKTPETVPASDTNLPGHNTVVEMPANPPTAPANFYPASMTTNNVPTTAMRPVGSESCSNVFLDVRGGYEHVNYAGNHDSYWASLKLYAYGDGLREAAGNNAWMIPDTEAEISTGYLPKHETSLHPGAAEGLRFRTAFTWPFLHWTAMAGNNSDSGCPFFRPLALGLGPTVNVGFDHSYDEARYRFARYGGVRLTFNRSGFIEYTVGGTDGLSGTRQQVVAEIPFYESRDGEVRYYLRGLWNRGNSDRPDLLEGGVFLELPVTLLVEPEKWTDLIPFYR